RRPFSGRGIYAPAIEMKEAFGGRAFGRNALNISAVEADHGKIAVFGPQTPDELPGLRAVDGGDIEHDTSDLTKKLAAHIFEAVSLTIEIVQVHDGHLREATREKRHRQVFGGR